MLIASASFSPFSPRLRTMMMSDVTLAPMNVSLLRRNAPTTSELPPSLSVSHKRRSLLLSSVPFEVMNTPSPFGASVRTFLAIQKSWMFLPNLRDRSEKPVSSWTLRPVTNGTLVIARLTDPGATLVFWKPLICTSASGYRSERMPPVMPSISTAWILLTSLTPFGMRASILPIPAEPSRMLPPLKPSADTASQIWSIIFAGV